MAFLMGFHYGGHSGLIAANFNQLSTMLAHLTTANVFIIMLTTIVYFYVNTHNNNIFFQIS